VRFPFKCIRRLAAVQVVKKRPNELVSGQHNQCRTGKERYLTAETRLLGPPTTLARTLINSSLASFSR
jgi:hypothetical protein